MADISQISLPPTSTATTPTVDEKSAERVTVLWGTEFLRWYLWTYHASTVSIRRRDVITEKQCSADDGDSTPDTGDDDEKSPGAWTVELCEDVHLAGYLTENPHTLDTLDEKLESSLGESTIRSLNRLQLPASTFSKLVGGECCSVEEHERNICKSEAVETFGLEMPNQYFQDRFQEWKKLNPKHNLVLESEVLLTLASLREQASLECVVREDSETVGYSMAVHSGIGLIAFSISTSQVDHDKGTPFQLVHELCRDSRFSILYGRDKKLREHVQKLLENFVLSSSMHDHLFHRQQTYILTCSFLLGLSNDPLLVNAVTPTALMIREESDSEFTDRPPTEEDFRAHGLLAEQHDLLELSLSSKLNISTEDQTQQSASSSIAPDTFGAPSGSDAKNYRWLSFSVNTYRSTRCALEKRIGRSIRDHFVVRRLDL